MNQVVHIPNEVPALMDYAVQALREQNYPHVIEACQAALAIDADLAQAHHYLAHAYKSVGQADMAQMMMARALQLAPADPYIHYNAAVEASERGEANRAILHYQQALRRAPDMINALWNCGELLRMDEHFQMALDCFERMVALGQTEYQGLWHRMAVCYAALERHDEALQMWQRAVEGEHDILSHWEYSFYLLSMESYKEGAQYYNDRFLCGGRNSVFQHEFDIPFWQGTFTKGMTLLLHGEQGLGDEIMFASMFNELLDEAQAAGAHVVIGCKPPLVRLFAHSFPRATVREHKVGEAPIDVSDLAIDAQMAMGHLMSRYRHQESDFATHRHAYLIAEPSRVQYYAQRIDIMSRPTQNGRKRCRVGLMWGSNPAQISSRFTRWAGQKSIGLPLFEDFAQLCDEVEFISLQNFERGAEAALCPELHMIDFSLDQADFYDTAALVANLDLVISVDTSVCHLTGGMAFETWVPLMARPDWRHGRTRETSLWYDKTRYFRQSKSGNWESVMEKMYEALTVRLKKAEK